MNSRTNGQWRWLWLSPLLVLTLACWCSLHGRALGEAAVGIAIALPWAIKSAVGWTAAGVLLGGLGHRVFGSAFARARVWTVRALVMLAVFTLTLSSEIWLLSGDVPAAEWLYNRSPLHFTFATLLVGGYLLVRARHDTVQVCAKPAVTEAGTPVPVSVPVSAPAFLPASVSVSEPDPTAVSDIAIASTAASGPAAAALFDIVEVMTGTGRTQVRLNDIECLEADRNYINVHTPHRSYLLRQTLSSLEESLRARDFVRIHRSTIVNRAMIREWRAGGVLVLSSGRTVRISRAFARQLH